ncbi:hypothetical protein SAMN05444722_1022 [Rhodovulum sp. ES.010]|uniref:hypothetical protein n=1 Tax=Rhodovulum sp. ES.010 TaxID=1882821 RepID=UPI000929F8C8|nr:hypothetical protein [Rhodovulum sp. ES.010]SIO25011.1 hypothetical protein SAMN05444722_1022 [Rhodovulum sp. ES.010]
MTKTILSAAVLALAPTLAAAECGWSKKMNANQCADGQIFDAASGTCVDQATS